MTDIDKIGKCARCGRKGKISSLNEKYCNACTEILLDEMLERMKTNNPLFDLEVEFGRLLQKHISDLTLAERKRYYELKEILENHGK